MLGYFKISFLHYYHVLQSLQILQFFSSKSIEKWVNWPFFETWGLRILTVLTSKLCQVVSNSDIKSPADQRECSFLTLPPLLRGHHCCLWAPWLMPISGSTQGMLNDSEEAWMLTHPPSHHLSTCHIITSNPSKHNAWWLGRAKGDWRGGIDGGKGGNDDKAAWNPHAALSNLTPPIFFISFLFLLLSFYDAACNPHAVLSISFDFYFIFMLLQLL
jgi:hypothetical protein